LSYTTAAIIGGAAGLSIFLGLPVARLNSISMRVQGLLNALATGVLVFLISDVLSHAEAPVEASVATIHGRDAQPFLLLVLIFTCGLGVGLLSLVYGNHALISRARSDGLGTDPRRLALAIAVGLGLHNLSEGLAIGESVATGTLAFAGVLVIGFALHNVTEGLGVAAPLAGDGRASWSFLAVAGLIGGGPTFVGTVIGLFSASSLLNVGFLALAAGALLWVINEMFSVSRRLNTPRSLAWGLLAGFLAAYVTDLLLSYLMG
jgi:ZIP family zinc transporter